MKKIIIYAAAILLLILLFRSCGGESRLQNKAISYMEAHVHQDGDWEAGDIDMDDLEDMLVELGAPKFKRGQHAVEVIVDLYGMEQSYIVWLQDKKVMYYEMTGNVNAGRITRSIYPSLTSKGWR